MVIVTGGTGFIGSNIVHLLNSKGINEILIVDNIASSNKYLNIANLDFADYIDKKAFRSVLPKLQSIEMIIHQGACSSTTETDGNYMIDNNYEYSKEILHYCIEKNTKLIYASSASVYGNGENGFVEGRGNEAPLNAYAFSKFLFDNYVRSIFNRKVNKSIITGLRYFNVFGYQENHKASMASVAYHFAQQIKKNNTIKLFEGSDMFHRDFIFIEDVMNVIWHFFENDINGIFNCGTGKARSFLDIAEIIQKTKSKINLNYIPFPDHLKGKYQKYTQADLTSLRNSGYNREFLSLEDSIKLYFEKLQSTNGYLV
jgi:ADP-L-glycero-D-manno-heptose 6-epimerase